MEIWNIVGKNMKTVFPCNMLNEWYPRYLNMEIPILVTQHSMIVMLRVYKQKIKILRGNLNQ